jgi:hypothetical protein
LLKEGSPPGNHLSLLCTQFITVILKAVDWIRYGYRYPLIIDTAAGFAVGKRWKKDGEKIL